MDEQRVAIKSKVRWMVAYFVLIGISFGWQFFFRANSNDNIVGVCLGLFFVGGPFAAAYGIGGREKWALSLGTFVSWIILLFLGWILFDFLGSLALNTLPALVTLIFIGANIAVIRTLSSLKNVFYE